eukprot:TRINITY_DN6306_c0_g1_i4.p2 TRINITY_DN6306_c0_g1~~TRINITY_DN6306_c0_g1_i4.p2  ORF type:complete len:103 (-),score=28.42 TRINITY_DN6306_c0_g1_i4:176-484(-)
MCIRDRVSTQSTGIVRQATMIGSWIASMMEDPEARDAQNIEHLRMVHAKAATQAKQWAEPTKKEGFWRHPLLNQKHEHNLTQMPRETRSIFQVPDFDRTLTQ